ncbi:MAG: hypothetical protein WC627_12025 [Legionella sp.]|jgi:hypothetical protein
MKTINELINEGNLNFEVIPDDGAVMITPLTGVIITIIDDAGVSHKLKQFEGCDTELWCFVYDNDASDYEFEIQAAWQNNCGFDTPLPMTVV